MRRSVVTAIVATQWQRWLRDRAVLGLGFCMAALLLCSVWLSVQHASSQAEQRTQMQVAAKADWDAQPDRHPHRVVHFGDFVYKPVQFFAGFDPGVEQHAGTSVYLEGHRQNSANFSEAAQSSSLQQFGTFSPAFVLQTLLPLLLIFLGFSSISAERESGLLTQLMSSGAGSGELVFGQFLALLSAALLALLPLAGLVALASLLADANAMRGLSLLLGYAAYSAICAAMITFAASLAQSAHAALMACLTIWAFACVAGPRLASQSASAAFAAPSWVEIEVAAETELKKIGNSHDPNDPYFAEFKRKTLAQFAAERVEDLPFNYGGLLMQEGERMTAEVFDKLNAQLQAQYGAQNQRVRLLAWFNPVMALSALSMSASGTDYAHHAHFLRATEARRFAMIQALNKIHTEHTQFAGDKEQKVGASFWQKTPRPAYQAPSLQLALPILLGSGLILALWLVLALLLLRFAAYKLVRG